MSYENNNWICEKKYQLDGENGHEERYSYNSFVSYLQSSAFTPMSDRQVSGIKIIDTHWENEIACRVETCQRCGGTGFQVFDGVSTYFGVLSTDDPFNMAWWCPGCCVRQNVSVVFVDGSTSGSRAFKYFELHCCRHLPESTLVGL